jgi:hypothetical protein
LVSSGSRGFWFFNCVVSRLRKVSKLPAIDLESVARPVPALEPEETPLTVMRDLPI